MGNRDSKEGASKQPKAQIKKVSKVKSSAKSTRTAKKSSDVTLADEILLLTQGLDPEAQTLFHRFSLRLQAKVAMQAVKWLSIYAGVLTSLLVVTILLFQGNVILVAVDQNGRLHSVATQDEEKWRDSKVINFANESTLDTFDISFLNFERRLEKTANTYYTDAGKSSLEVAMRPVIQSLRNQQATLHAEENGPGIIIDRDPDGDTDWWVVRKEYLITFIPAEGEAVTNKRTVTTRILKLNDYESLKGLGVQQIVQGGV